VTDIDEAPTELADRGIHVGQMFHDAAGDGKTVLLRHLIGEVTGWPAWSGSSRRRNPRRLHRDPSARSRHSMHHRRDGETVRRSRGQHLRHPCRLRELQHALGLAALTKGGLASATRSLAIEYASRGIRVNAVSPGIIQTPMHPVNSYSELGDRLPPLGRVGQVSDVVDAILFLESSPYITGEILHVDGAQIAGH
jgi:NAD(P)-dependent dehydrogenase (short-subunit alcohol dehydrogenase family)